MWVATGNDVSMCEGDFGVELPIKISGATFGASDEILFTLKTAIDGEIILEKSFSNIQENTVYLVLTGEESETIDPGVYVYALDWYQDGVFLCNVIPSAMFRVVNKA